MGLGASFWFVPAEAAAPFARIDEASRTLLFRASLWALAGVEADASLLHQALSQVPFAYGHGRADYT